MRKGAATVGEDSEAGVAETANDGSSATNIPSVGRLQETPNARRETGILAAAVTAVPLLVASGISLIPQLEGVWPTALGIAVLVVITVVVGVQIVRSARKLLVGQGADTEILAYQDDRESGILRKGDIPNVSLRVSTIHLIVDTLTQAIPDEDNRQSALYQCGAAVGESWVTDFHKQLLALEIEKSDLLRQLLKWSEYDATAGMGRLTVAVNPKTGEGLVALANSFLSRSPSRFPLNWWFAGYLAGSLRRLLDREVLVELLGPTEAAAPITLFQVIPGTGEPEPPPTRVGPRHPQSVARGRVLLKKLKRPLPEEEPMDT
ncbi:MAG: hypothetical protein E6G34_02255 [Actinobacteria bacterium]|nr:MAG: hypothetical protein E6G34_02255 [Actinomycetota bacterium]